ncbi:peptidylprolyl isomerase [Pseudomonadales bacterium]|jgi:peptidyl-prolyl cis-trans isomerase A (cyclophilin A)|nr:peptidylprolyl isomerase [Pseudomonadales bacterium]MDB2596781.1 peptidylprolyl isomerase [Pseudomonadales bacterium]MDC1322496.1 peptidylprolyl isomerase [Pseudomonadales bacterium]
MQNIFTKITFMGFVILTMAGLLQIKNAAAENPQVALVTNVGEIQIELLPKFSPKHVSNFLALIDENFYVGLVFHRVIPNFMIQAGGYTENLTYRPTNRSVANESLNGLKNRKYTVAMARLDHPDSGDTQFFINVGNNTHLDATPDGPGYSVFGRVISGRDVIETIELVDTGISNGMVAVPETPIVILATRRL